MEPKYEDLVERLYGSKSNAFPADDDYFQKTNGGKNASEHRPKVPVSEEKIETEGAAIEETVKHKDKEDKDESDVLAPKKEEIPDKNKNNYQIKKEVSRRHRRNS